MAIKELSDLNPDGTRLGQSAADKIGFYGLATPIAQRSGSSMTALTITVKAISGGKGFTTSAKMNAFTAQVEEIRATLVALGLHAGA